MDGVKEEALGTSNDTNNNSGKQGSKRNMKNKQQKDQLEHPNEDEFESAEQDIDEDDDDDDDEEEDEEVEEDEEIEEEVEEDEEEDEEEEGDEKAQKTSSQHNASQSSSGQQGSGGNSINAGSLSGSQPDKRPRLTDELYEMNLRRKKEHVGSALYIPFPRKVSEEEVRSFVGQGPNIFLVGPQKQNAIVRYRTQAECEKQQKELAKKEFESQTLNIEPKTVKIDPANIDVKTLIVQYSNPDLSIMDFAQIFIKAISISLKGGKNRKDSQSHEDLSFGSAIIIFPSHEEAKEAFLATENLTIKNEQLRVVFADFRPSGSSTRPNPGGFGFNRNKGGDNGRGNFNRGNQGGRPNFRNRNRNSGSGPKNFGARNFHSNSGSGGGGGGGGGNYNQGRNYSPNKKFRSNVR